MTQTPLFSFQELLQATDGQWLVPPCPTRATCVTDVCDDSRGVTPGSMFVAIVGEFADGHDYILDAVRAGAAVVCVEREPNAETAGAVRAAHAACLMVDNSLNTFQQLAKAHRCGFPDLCVVGLTGSSGKTSTKEMVAAVLEQRWPERVLKTEGNTNNHFGVPRNLLRLTAGHRAAVIEMGTNHPGEIELLTHMTVPTIGMVSDLGSAHLGNFGGRSDIAREKSAIFGAVPQDGTVIFPSDSDHTEILRTAAGQRAVVTFGTADAADIVVGYEGRVSEGFRVRLTWRRQNETRCFTWPHGGRHQALNAGAASAAGTAAGVAPDEIIAGLQQCRLPKMRMEVRERNGTHWVNDAYNANPDSMRASVEWVLELTEGVAPTSLVFVLGDMLELGRFSQQEHEALLDWVMRMAPEAMVLTVGPCMEPVAAHRGIRHFPDAASVRAFLHPRLRPSQWVLLKGSRGIGLEAVLPEGGD